MTKPQGCIAEISLGPAPFFRLPFLKFISLDSWGAEPDRELKSTSASNTIEEVYIEPEFEHLVFGAHSWTMEL